MEVRSFEENSNGNYINQSYSSFLPVSTQDLDYLKPQIMINKLIDWFLYLLNSRCVTAKVKLFPYAVIASQIRGLYIKGNMNKIKPG